MAKVWIFFATLIVLCPGLLTANSHAEQNPMKGEKSSQSSSPQPASPPPLQLVGEGTMRWLWFDLYQVKLSTPSGRYHSQQWPLALELIYARDISRKDLVQATEEEWQRQQINYQKNWLTQLSAIWPNITTRDKLLLSVDDKGHSDFFYNGQYIGRLSDRSFTDAFIAIWLSNNTLKPSLRNQLIGLNP